MFLERSCIWFFRKSGIAKVYWLQNTLITVSRVLYERKNSNKSSWSYGLLSKLVWQWPMWLCRGSSNTSNTSIFSEALSSVGATAAVIYSSSNSVFWISTTMCDIGQVVRWYVIDLVTYFSRCSGCYKWFSCFILFYLQDKLSRMFAWSI